MSNNDVKINIETAVKNQKDVIELQKEIVKLGDNSKETDKQVEDLATSMNDLVVATQLRDKLIENNAELDKTTEALNNARSALVKSREELSLFNESTDPTQLKEMNKSISDQEKEIKKLERAQETARKKYEHTNKAIEKSSDNIQKLARDNGYYADSTLKAAKAQESLIEEIGKTKDFLESYKKLGVIDHKKEIEDLEKSYKTLKESGKLSTEELEDAHRKLTDEVEKHKKALSGTEQLYKNFKKWSLRLAPVAAALAAVTKSAVEYENAMVGLRKVASGTDEELNKLEKDVLKLSRTIPMSAAEIAKMAEAGARAGKSVNELTGFVELSAKAANAFGVSAEDAGKYISTLGSVFGGTAEETEKLVEAINMFDDTIDASAADITTVINNIGAIGQAAGLSGEQLSALSATVLAAGNTASVTSTSLKNFLNGLANVKNGTSDAKKSLESLGFSVEGFSQQLRDNGEQAIVDFLTRLGQLEKQAQIDVAGKMFGSAAQAQVMQMALTVDVVAEQFKKAGDYASYAGKVTEQFNKTNQSTSAQYQIVKNQLNEISIELGTHLLPIIKDTLSVFTEIIKGTKRGINAIGSLSDNLSKLGKASDDSNIILSALKLTLSALISPIEAAAKGYSHLYDILKASNALADAQIKEEEIRQEYIKKGIILNKDGSITIEKKTEAIKKETEATKADTEAKKDKIKVNQEEVSQIATLNESLEKLGLSYNQIELGLTKAGEAAIDTFNQVGNHAKATSQIINQSFGAALNEVSTPQEFLALMESFRSLGEQGKITATDMGNYKLQIDELYKSVRLGIITDAEFAEKKKEISGIIAEQVNGFSALNHEISKQVQLINTQIALDKKLVDSVIRKLEAEKEMAKATNDTVKVQETERQIQAVRIGGMKDEAKAVAKLVEEYKKELLVLESRKANGEALTEAEEQRVRVLNTEITARNNEVEAINKSAEAKERDIAMSHKNASVLDSLAKSANNAASAQSNVSSTASKTGDSAEKATKSGGGMNSWLKGMADESKKSTKALDDLRQSMAEITNGAITDKMGVWTSYQEAIKKQADLRNEIIAQIKKSEALEEEIGKGASQGLIAIEAMQASVKELHYVNEEVTVGMTDNLKKMANEAKNVYAEIDRESADMIGNLTAMRNQNELHQLRMKQSNERASLESKIMQAQEDGDMIRTQKLKEQRLILQQVQSQEQRMARDERQAQERGKNQKLDINLNGTNLKNLDPDNPEDMRKISEAVVKEINKDKKKSTKFVIKDQKRRT